MAAARAAGRVRGPGPTLSEEPVEEVDDALWSHDPVVLAEEPSSREEAVQIFVGFVDEPEREFFTPEARLVVSGWEPPDAELLELIVRREALWAALGELTAYDHAVEAMDRAVLSGDRDGLIRAVTSEAIASWADARFDVFTGLVGQWDVSLADAMSDRIARDPEAILASLAELEDDPDARNVREEAEGYVERWKTVGGLIGPNRRPPPAPRRRGFSRVPRHVLPLPRRG
jgi:hypothetical protein